MTYTRTRRATAPGCRRRVPPRLALVHLRTPPSGFRSVALGRAAIVADELSGVVGSANERYSERRGSGVGRLRIMLTRACLALGPRPSTVTSVVDR